MNTPIDTQLSSLIIGLAPFIEYREYLSLVCDDKFMLVKHELETRGLALSFGTTHMKDFLIFKKDIYTWILEVSTDEQQDKLINFITNYKADLCLRKHKHMVKNSMQKGCIDQYLNI